MRQRVAWSNFLAQYLSERPQLKLLVHLIDGEVGPTDVDRSLMATVGNLTQGGGRYGAGWGYAVALTKLDDDARKFHKAKGAGMWDFALDELGVADKAACNARSCYVGDSDADENLARVAGVRYHHVRDYFGAMFPRP